ncbi:MAG TPA: phosphoribosyl-AMP cyclohydrolase [Isosphaeraceae bacterium]|jgi:phosphoribosyl-AMP cyclohydrolase|nr:phosphoribosyl-AMP cyclohydrolase [Isosphaeraceae bacterium]
MSSADAANLSSIKWSPQGLVPAIVQDSESGEVLMMAWMNAEALRLTLATGQTHFYSRSRASLWRKGDTSGHVQHVEEIRLDCDADVLLIRARQVGGACHEGYRSCFFRKLEASGETPIVAQRLFDPARIYPKDKPPPGSG